MDGQALDADGHVEVAAAEDDGFDRPFFSGTDILLHRAVFVNLEELRPDDGLFARSDLQESREDVAVVDNNWSSDKLSYKGRPGLAVNIQRRPDLFDMAVVGDDDFIGHFDGFVLVVGDEDAGNADAVDCILEPVAQFLADLGVDGGKRFIQEQDLGIRRQGPGKGHALALATGKLVGIALFHARQADEVDHFQYALAYLLFRPLLDFQAEGDVVVDGHIAEQSVVLEDEADAPLGSGNVVDPAAVDENVAAVGILQAGQHAQNRRLAAAAGTEEGDELALVDAEGNVARRVEGPVILFDVFHFDVHELHLLYDVLSALASRKVRSSRTMMANKTSSDDTAKAAVMASADPD